MLGFRIEFIVCEDNDKTRKTITSWLNPYIKEANIELVLSTSEPSEVLNLFNNAFQSSVSEIRICLLDINLNKEINGVALAENIKNKSPQTKIVFITAHAEWAVESLNRNIEPFAYLTKPLDRDTFDWHIKRLIKKCRELYMPDNQEPVIALEAFGKIYYKPINIITYIETYHKEGYLAIHTISKEKIIHRSRLSDMMAHLEQISPETFFKCYKSYIVNIHLIQNYDRTNKVIKLKNGIILNISRSRSVIEKLEERIVGEKRVNS